MESTGDRVAEKFKFEGSDVIICHMTLNCLEVQNVTQIK